MLIWVIIGMSVGSLAFLCYEIYVPVSSKPPSGGIAWWPQDIEPLL